MARMSEEFVSADPLQMAALAAVGQFSIASLHALKNEVFAATGTVEVLRRQADPKSPLAQRLGQIEASGRDTEIALRLLLDLAASLNHVAVRFPLAEAAEQACALLAHSSYRGRVEKGERSGARIEAPRALIVLSLLHLLANAVEAAPLATLSLGSDDESVWARVSNPGLLPAAPAPFRTEKTRLAAVGLGLPFVRAAAAACNAHFTLRQQDEQVEAELRFPALG